MHIIVFVPDLIKVFSFSPLSIMLAVDLTYMAFIMFRYVHSMPAFYQKWILKVFIISAY